MKNVLLSTVALVALTGTAIAGNLVVPVVAPAPVVFAEPDSDWSGFYGGLHGGFGDATIGFDPIPIGITLAYQGYGLHAGYMHDFGNLVAIGEISGDRLDLTDITMPSDHEIQRVGADVMLGYDGGKVMPFAGIGYANLTFSVTGVGFSESTDGFAVTAGVAYKATDNLMLDARVRHTTYSDMFGIPDVTLAATAFMFGLSWHQ
ncbi:MAG: porin family protein [Rhodobacteraceae bacterium]|nr:porin family protein [Paracoccaceae bacterium]